MATAAWCDVHPSQLAGPGACFKEYDLLTVTVDELKAPLQVRVFGPWPVTDLGLVVCTRQHLAVARGGRAQLMLSAGCGRRPCGLNDLMGCRRELSAPAVSRRSALILQASCQLRILDGGLVDAYCGWFDTRFKGSPENPADFEVSSALASLTMPWPGRFVDRQRRFRRSCTSVESFLVVIPDPALLQNLVCTSVDARSQLPPAGSSRPS